MRLQAYDFKHTLPLNNVGHITGPENSEFKLHSYNKPVILNHNAVSASADKKSRLYPVKWQSSSVISYWTNCMVRRAAGQVFRHHMPFLTSLYSGRAGEHILMETQLWIHFKDACTICNLCSVTKYIRRTTFKADMPQKSEVQAQEYCGFLMNHIAT